MNTNELIVTVPAVCGGRPRIAGTRISVELVQDHIAAGYTSEQIQRAYPHLSIEQIEAAACFTPTSPESLDS